MGELVDLVMARPIVNAALIAREPEITPRAAQTLVADLNLRELTGRGGLGHPVTTGREPLCVAVSTSPGILNWSLVGFEAWQDQPSILLPP